MSIAEPAKMAIWKRGIDLACCVVALPILCIVTVPMALILKLTSPGPIFFRQERVGYKGSRFMCLKFRTMTVGADTKSHQAYLDSLLGANTNAPMVKLDSKGDSRLIAGGWFVRAIGIDELPQILNVLNGDMSVVGPRPCLPYEFEKYKPAARDRFKAVPGLTGLWQVSGKNRTTFDEMIRLDIQYAETTTFWQDLRIILMTVPALIIQLIDTRRARKSRTQTAQPIFVRRPAPPVKSGSQPAVS